VVHQLRDADHRAQTGAGVTTRPDLSIAIVNFNTRARLERTLHAVLADTRRLSAETLVVDNASRDRSADMVRDAFPAVALLANPHNRFYAAGNNQALARSQGRYVLVLNPDAEPAPGTLPAMVAYMDRHPDVGALSGLMRFEDGTVQHNCARLRTYRQLLLEYTVLGWLRPRARRRALDEYWYRGWDRTSERDVEVVPGSCLMVRREVLDGVGAFDERLQMYFAEDDWCLRIRAAGWRVRYAPIGAVVHSEGASVRQARRLARRIYFGDMVRYARKHFGRARGAWLWLLTRPTRWMLDLAGFVRDE
jgi:GT2 family glycosyltransferase